MAIYDINYRIDDLCEQYEELMAMAVDDNGCINEDAIAKAMSITNEKAMLEMERDEFYEGIALSIKNLDADAKAIREEEKALAERRKALEKKAENRRVFLEGILAGEKFKTSKVAISYRKSTAVKLDEGFTEWATENKQYLRYKEPEVDKAALTVALKNGIEIPYASLEEHMNMSIK